MKGATGNREGLYRALTGALHYALLAIPLVLYVLFTVMAAHPYLFDQRHARERDYYYYEQALWYARQPIQDTVGCLVFRGHNPAFFMAVLQIAIRAGIDSIYEMHMIILALNIGFLLMLYLLIRSLFRNRWFALFSVMFLIASGACRYYAFSIHAVAFGRFFCIASCLIYLYYLRTSNRWLLALACGLYFLACWNYWERYVETGLLLWGIHYVERRRLFSFSLVSLAVSALMALGSFLLLASFQWEGRVTEVVRELQHMATLRSLDVASGRYEHHQSLQYIDTEKASKYLQIVSEKLEGMYFIPPAVWALLLAAVLFTAAPERKRAYTVLPFAFAAAFYWHMFMYQHVITIPHIAYHHYFFLGIIFGAFIVEVPLYIYRQFPDRVCKSMLAGALIFPAIFPVVEGGMRLYIPPYINSMQHVAFIGDLRARAMSADREIREAAREQLREELHKRIKWQPEFRQDITAHVLSAYLHYPDDGSNLLANGGFESWDDEARRTLQLPDPALSVVRQESSLAGEGKYAVRQTWNTDSDGAASIYRLFGFVVSDLKPNTDYMLRAQAFNARGGEVIVSAWDAPPYGTEGTLHRLKLNVLQIPPSKGHALQQFTGVFTTPDKAEPFHVLLLTSARPAARKREAYVIWDDFQLYELGPSR